MHLIDLCLSVTVEIDANRCLWVMKTREVTVRVVSLYHVIKYGHLASK